MEKSTFVLLAICVIHTVIIMPVTAERSEISNCTKLYGIGGRGLK